MPRIQLKLALALALLAAVTTAGAGWVAERGLREREISRIERSLSERTRLVAQLVGDRPLAAQGTGQLTEIAVRAARASAARVTLIGPDGTVLADSDVAAEALDGVENHGDRPEVSAALAGRSASSTRRSSTVDRELLYLAVPSRTDASAGVVRLAVDLSDVQDAVSELHRQLLVAGLIGLLGALALSFVLAPFVIRPLRRIRATLGSIESGDLGARVRLQSRDEIGEIADAIDKMGDELQGRMRELTADQEQLQTVLRSMVDGVLVVDGDGRIVLANERLRDMLRLPGETEGQKLEDVIDNAEIASVVNEALRAREPQLREMQIQSPGRRDLQVHAVAFSTASGGTGAVVVFRDVTEVRRLETIRRDFVANASHEIRTPLTAIRGFTETLLNAEPSPEDVERYLRIVLQNSERLGALVDDLLELSRIESGGQRLEHTKVDLVSITTRLLQQQEPRFTERSIELTFRDRGAPQVIADAGAVEQVLINLLDNALKYTEAGGRVAIEVAAAGRFVRVDVTDTGIGIGEADRERIFERFYRVDKARSRELGGTGLGLSIVKHLVQAMGGEIGLKSKAGVGSTFSFTLPRAAETAPTS